MRQAKPSVQYWSPSIKVRPQFFDEQHFVNEAVKFPTALLENTKFVLIKKIFVTMHF